jgi:prepilin-type processing-associated H-X9-DG protein
MTEPLDATSRPAHSLLAPKRPLGLHFGFGAILAATLLCGCHHEANPAEKSDPQKSECANNLEQIAMAFRAWALEHNGRYPFNVSTNAGGTLELLAPDPSGLDRNSWLHFQAMSNQLSTTDTLLCPRDHSKWPAPNFQGLRAANVTYRLYTGTNVGDAHPNEPLATCPIDGNVLYCDGSVHPLKPPP